jgi:hypothetical protein
MARIRSLHPPLWTDAAFVSVQPLARLLAIGLWGECDDAGIFQWNPLQLKLRLLPADNCDPAALLMELTAANIIRTFAVGDAGYGAVRNFGKFQSPKKPFSRHPLPDEFRTYLGLSDTDFPANRGIKASEFPTNSPPAEVKTPTGSPPVRNQLPTNATPVHNQLLTGSESVPHKFGTGTELDRLMERRGIGREGRGREAERDGKAIAAAGAAPPPRPASPNLGGRTGAILVAMRQGSAPTSSWMIASLTTVGHWG